MQYLSISISLSGFSPILRFLCGRPDRGRSRKFRVGPGTHAYTHAVTRTLSLKLSLLSLCLSLTSLSLSFSLRGRFLSPSPSLPGPLTLLRSHFLSLSLSLISLFFTHSPSNSHFLSLSPYFPPPLRVSLSATLSHRLHFFLVPSVPHLSCVHPGPLPPLSLTIVIDDYQHENRSPSSMPVYALHFH